MSLLNFFKSSKSHAIPKTAIQEMNSNERTGIGPSHELKPTEVKVMDSATYLASDEKAWLRYLSQPLRTYRKPGVTMKEEFELWTASRERSRSASAANGQQAIRA